MDQDSEKTIVPSNLLSSAQSNHSSEQDASDTLPVGTRLGEFEILSLVGKGGFGIVYRAYDHSLECEVALKEFMPSGLATRSQTVLITVRSHADIETFNMGLQSFIKEARMLRRFDSPSLVKVFRFWEANGTAYMVMPFYEGMTLKQAVKAKTIVPDEAWIKFFLGNLLDAIDIIHRANCYHRDIAPDNIILQSSDGHPILLDFGAARRVISDSTQLQTAILKPGFAPIEQYADIPGVKQGSWTDIYALGALVYYLITGRAPVAAVSRVVNDNNVPARDAGKGRFSPAFLDAIDRAIAVRPENRIRDVAEWRAALGLAESPSMTLPPPVPPAPRMDERIEPVFPGTFPVTEKVDAQNWQNAPFFRDPDGDKARAPAAGQSRKFAVIGSVAVAALVVVGAGIYLGTKSPANVAANQPDITEKSASTESPARPTDAVPPTAAATVPPAAEPGAPPAKDGQAASGPVADAMPGKAAAQASAAREAAAEEASWSGALASNSVPGYETYRKAYPNGQYAAAAAKAIEKLAAAAAAAKPNAAAPAAAASAPAVAGTDPPANLTAAQTAALEEESTWRIVSSMDNMPAYESYLSKYPKGKYAARARTKIQEAAKASSTAAVANAAPPTSPDAGKPSLPAAPPAPAKAPGATTASAPQPASNASAAVEPVASATPSVSTPPAATAPGAGAPTVTKSGSSKSGESADVVATLRPQDAAKPAQAAPQPSGQVLHVGNQTLTGNFTTDPITGLVSGTGQVRFANGDRYEGTLARGVRQGKGDFVWANGQRYQGEWSRDVPNGKGTMSFQNGNVYEGDMKDGVPNGKGVLTFGAGHRYRGEVKDGLPHGKGTTRFSNGDSYIGDWRQGKSQGQGRYVWANGGYWEGEFKDDKRTENGRMVTAAEASANGAIASTSAVKDNAGDETAAQTAAEPKN